MKAHSTIIHGLLLLIPTLLITAFLVSGISRHAQPAADEGFSIHTAAVLTPERETVWNLYPSPDPLSHAFLIDWPHNHTEANVYDLEGRLVPVEISIRHNEDNWQYQIGANLGPGLYFLQMRSGNEVGYTKLAMAM